MWSLLLTITLAAVPRYAEIDLHTGVPAAPSELPPPLEFVKGIIELNETLSTTLTVHDISHSVAYEVARVVSPIFDVRDFKPGHAFQIIKEADGTLRAFDYTIDDERILRVDRKNDQFFARVKPLSLEVREGTVTAMVNKSLWAALESIPKGDWLVMELAAVFEAQIDFHKDIRFGDAIRLIVDEKYHRGKFVKYGPVP